MDGRSFLGLDQHRDDPLRWQLPVRPDLCTPPGNFLFGGCGLGAAIAAMEGSSGRPLIWATAQYLAYAPAGSVLDIDVTLAAVGHQVTQARAVGHVGDQEILTVNAALGERPGFPEGQFEAAPPEVPPPDSLPKREHRMGDIMGVHNRLDERLIVGRGSDERDGTLSDGRALMWARIPEVIEAKDATRLAVLGDFVPMGVGMALGIQGGATSLDNTLRVVELVPTKWVLLDVRVHAAARGFAHGLVHMFAEDGTLMATASQSCVVRYWR